MNGRFSMFDTDYDGDGELDTSTRASWAPYNEARPKVHNGGCNVGLLDGHASYVKFNDFWEIDENREMKHPYWKIRK
jgi:prepilin-type processing-associated H-X9-DG protein